MVRTMDDLRLRMDLQLFAADETQTTLLPGLSVEMKTYYEKRLVDNAEPNLVHDQFGDKYPIPQHGGKTIEFRKYSPLPKALTALSEGVTPPGNRLNVTALTAEIAQYGDYIELSDLLEMTAIDRNVEQATKLLGAQAGRTLDTITREILAGGTNVMYAPKTDGTTETEVLLREDIDATAALSSKVVRMAAATLKRMNTNPIDDSFVAIIHPDVACDLQGDREWIESHKYAQPENIYRGEIGKIGGVRFVESTEAKIIGPAYIFGDAHSNGVARMTLRTALNATGSTTIAVNEEVTAVQAAAFNARIAGGEEIHLYVGGKDARITASTAGAAGAATFTASAAVKDVPAGAAVTGSGAGAGGAAVYCTLIIGANAYGVTEVEGGGLEHIVKQRGSGGTTDPLNQRSTTGWKATKVAERLVEAYMVRVEHGSPSFSMTAVSN